MSMFIFMRNVSREDPLMKACQTKEGRAQALQNHIDGQKQWQTSVDAAVAKLSTQCKAYEQLMANPDLAPIKDKVSGWHSKAMGERQGLLTTIASPDAMQRIEKIAEMIIGLDQKETVTPADILAVKEQMGILQTQKSLTEETLKDYIMKMLTQAKEKCANKTESKSNTTCMSCNGTVAELKALNHNSDRIEKYLKASLEIFNNCMKAIQTARAPQV